MQSIAFVGKAGSGKTTAAEFLRALYPDFEHVSFAEPLKDIAEEIWGPEARINRTKLIGLGTAVRDIDVDAWVNLVAKKIEEHDHVVIDDCRYRNEYFALMDLNFTFIRIKADELTRVNRLQANGKFITHEQMQSKSETDLDDIQFEFNIKNDGDLLEFYESLAKTLTSILS